MAIPIIVAGAGAGAYGAKKVIDSIKNNEEAKMYITIATNLYKITQDELEESRKNTAKSLEDLGWQKLNVWDRQMGCFVRIVEQIRDVKVEGEVSKDEFFMAKYTHEELGEIKQISLKASEVVTGGLASVTTGALISAATYSGVMALGTASTGTAIASLSGAAATSATLAWLGGGSLAAGGLGMAGGMAVLGGIVLAPAIAVGGVLLANKSKENLAKSKQTLAEANKAIAEMDNAKTVLNSIKSVSDEYKDVIGKLDIRMTGLLSKLSSVIIDVRMRKCIVDGAPISYLDMTDEEKHLVHVSYLSAQVMKQLLQTPLLDQNDTLTENCKLVIDKGRKYLDS